MMIMSNKAGVRATLILLFIAVVQLVPRQQKGHIWLLR